MLGYGSEQTLRLVGVSVMVRGVHIITALWKGLSRGCGPFQWYSARAR